MPELPLFPLGSVLLPDGRMSLQVFEQRYLDLVRDSLREDRAFGTVWIREGSEVNRPGSGDPELAEVGVEVRIVDWDSLPNNLLGIVIEGQRRFSINKAWSRSNGLWVADVDFWEPEPRMPLPVEGSDWLALLQRLGEHPHVKRLGMSLDVDDAATLGHRLAQLLPIDEYARYQLLTAVDPVSRLDQLHDLLSTLSD